MSPAVQRIGAGTLRGRVLRPLPGAGGVRPTGSRVREAIFDRLQHEVVDAVVLDLFAGSGALAIEALSRGAARATLVERDPRIVRHLTAQISSLDLSEQTQVVRGEAAAVLRGSTQGLGGPFTLVLLDPPYEEVAALIPQVGQALLGGHLAADAIVVCEYDRKQPRPVWPLEFTLETTRNYGQTGVDFLRVGSGASR